jgi:hypothetical protein
MTQGQRNQIVKTLHVFAWIATAIAAAQLAFAVVYSLVFGSVDDLIEGLISGETYFIIMYSAIGAAVVFFWLKSFIIAGSKGKQD